MAIDPLKLRRIKDLPAHVPESPDEAYIDRKNGVCVQVWTNATPVCNDTPWAGTLMVAIKHTAAKTSSQFARREFSKPITWDDMQAIKDYFWPDQIAIEIFPPHDKIVNVADIRWMWVLPKGAILPFNLQEGVDVLVSG
jgi:hypothetical protein